MESEDVRRLREIAERIARSPRIHASFWEWPDKQQKEFGICDELANFLEIERAGTVISGIEPGDDPPDCVMISSDRRIGVEITEFVDQRSIEAQINSGVTSEIYSEWTAQRTSTAISSIFERKDRSIGNYDEKILLIHTDEPCLSVADYDGICGDLKFVKPKHFDSTYIVFGYNPGTKQCDVRLVC